MIKRSKDYLGLLKHTIRLLSQNDPLVLASSTAFFTTFAIAPILLLLVSIFGLFVSDSLIRSQLFDSLSEVMGTETASTVENILENIRALESNIVFTIAGSIFLFFVATTVLLVVQSSINRIWGISQKPEKNIKRAVRDRVISFMIILFSGLLIFTSFLSQTVITIIRENLDDYFPEVNWSLLQIVNELVSFVVVVVWFAVILKFLPAGRLRWKHTWIGAFGTAILFSLGRLILVRLLPQTNIGTVYGAGGSVVLILLFIFYSSLIFYLGAAFTRAYAEHRGERVKPRPYAVRYKYVEFD